MRYKNLFLKLFFGFLLLLGGFIFVIHDIFFTDSFSVLSYYHEPIKNEQQNNTIFKFKITAQENNLGIITTKLHSKKRITNKKVTFLIKDTQNNNILSTSHYNSDYFDYEEYFPFGFPAISDSKNKTYEFQLIVSDKQLLNDLILVQDEPIITKYVFTSDLVTQDYETFINFVFKKFHLYISFIPNIIKALFYFIPFFVYVFFVLNLFLYIESTVLKIATFLPKKLQKKAFLYYERYKSNRTRYIGISSVPIWILLHAIMIPGYNGFLYIVMLGYLIFIIKKLKLSTHIFFYYEFVLLFFIIVTLFFNLQSQAEIFAIWIYTLFWFIAISFIHNTSYKVLQKKI